MHLIPQKFKVFIAVCFLVMLLYGGTVVKAQVLSKVDRDFRYRETLLPKANKLSDKVVLTDIGRYSHQPDLELMLVSLQGIVNQKQPRLFLDGVGLNTGIWLQNMLDKGYISDVEVVDGFDNVLRYFKHEVEGMVVTDPDISATINVATMLAGLHRVLIVSPELIGRGTAAGLSIVFDLRGRWSSNHQAYRWAFDELYPQMSRSALAVLWPGKKPYVRDYLISQKIFTFWLDASGDTFKSIAEHRKELAVVENILASTPSPMPVIGFWHGDEGIGIGEYEGVKLGGQYGKLMIVCDLALNLSLHSGIRVSDDRFAQKAKDQELPQWDPEKIYLSVLIQESGDAPVYWQTVQRTVWLDQSRGNVPIGWCLGPATLDLMPDILEYFYENATERDYFYTAISGIGYFYPLLDFGSKTTDPDAVLAEVLKLTETYMKKLDLRMIGVYTLPWTRWIEDEGRKVFERYAREIGGLEAILPDMGRNDGITWKNANYVLSNGVPVFHCLTRWDPNRVGKKDEQSVDWLVDEIRRNSPSAGPGFMQIMAISWTYTPNLIKSIEDKLGDRYVFVTPEQLARLYLLWNKTVD